MYIYNYTYLYHAIENTVNQISAIQLYHTQPSLLLWNPFSRYNRGISH